MNAVPLVCPRCLSAESLYSIEQAEIMYPIAPMHPQSAEVELYTGEDSIVLDEGTIDRGDWYCRGCDSHLDRAGLIVAPPL